MNTFALAACSSAPIPPGSSQAGARLRRPFRVCARYCESVTVSGKTKTDPREKLTFDLVRLCIKPTAKDLFCDFRKRKEFLPSACYSELSGKAAQSTPLRETYPLTGISYPSFFRLPPAATHLMALLQREESLRTCHETNIHPISSMWLFCQVFFPSLGLFSSPCPANKDRHTRSVNQKIQRLQPSAETANQQDKSLPAWAQKKNPIRC
ncbi:uncharacterized protein LOC134513803 [Chroicocephalus ridibundus]|uniref:uncharacterized protein LOC134513803 n=1 Tax=Chroicocephalus ridibundus TaxID=1192867 RepID=UPI002FDE37D9